MEKVETFLIPKEEQQMEEGEDGESKPKMIAGVPMEPHKPDTDTSSELKLSTEQATATPVSPQMRLLPSAGSRSRAAVSEDCKAMQDTSLRELRQSRKRQ